MKDTYFKKKKNTKKNLSTRPAFGNIKGTLRQKENNSKQKPRDIGGKKEKDKRFKKAEHINNNIKVVWGLIEREN